MLSDRGSVAIDARTNTLMVTDTPDRVEAIQKLVRDLDRPVRQVQIESRIVIASSEFAHAIGVRFGVTALHNKRNILAISGDSEGADLVNPCTNPRDDGLIDIPGHPGPLTMSTCQSPIAMPAPSGFHSWRVIFCWIWNSRHLKQKVMVKSYPRHGW